MHTRSMESAYDVRRPMVRRGTGQLKVEVIQHLFRFIVKYFGRPRWRM